MTEASKLAEELAELMPKGGPGCTSARLLHKSMLESLLYRHAATILAALRSTPKAPQGEAVGVDDIVD